MQLLQLLIVLTLPLESQILKFSSYGILTAQTGNSNQLGEIREVNWVHAKIKALINSLRLPWICPKREKASLSVAAQKES